MGKGGNSISLTTDQNDYFPSRVPHTKPPFTLSDIKKAIPPHCFERSLIRSLWYPLYDIILWLVFYYVADNFFHFLPKPLNYVAWTAYAYAQGCLLFGIWCIAHDCGHNAFSKYHWINDTVGFVLHSFVLVPYFSLKISHRHHHANTNSIERDENHVPMFKDNLRSYFKLLDYGNIGEAVFLALYPLVGYLSYMLFNISGHTHDSWTSHFNPFSPMYTKNERLHVVVSDIGVFGVIYMCYRLALVKGFASVMLLYGGPIVVMWAFLVFVSFLHHNHVSMPHYDSSEWDWLRGALATIDRNYGILNKVFHHLTDTHVLHHLIPTIPHYHAEEATNAIKPVLGDYYFYDGTPFYKALWRETKECVYVQADPEGDKAKGVYWFKIKPSVKSD